MTRTKETCKEINSHIPCRSSTEELYVKELLGRLDSNGNLYWSVGAWNAFTHEGLMSLLREGTLHAVRSDDEEHEGIILTIQKK